MKSDMCTMSAPDKPALSEEEVERKSKSIIDEFLHINDFKVNVDSDKGKQLLGSPSQSTVGLDLNSVIMSQQGID